MEPPKSVVVTGARGFLGLNLCWALERIDGLSVRGVDLEDPPDAVDDALRVADVVFHLAGVNRPNHPEEFEPGNAGITRALVSKLDQFGRHPLVVFASSIQAALDNPYGVSKKLAEDALHAYAAGSGAAVALYRLPNVFGKWGRPNYNSAVATFCYNIARGLDITITDPKREVELVHVDDVVAAFREELRFDAPGGVSHPTVAPVFRVTLKDLADRIYALRATRETLLLPDMADPLTRRLQATYLAYLDTKDFAYGLQKRTDPRGSLAELLKAPSFGQVFVSRTRPGITRGNHYHDCKVEKFCVVEGSAIIRFRDIRGAEILEYPVDGTDFRVVDIPPGYTHSIENVGSGELVVLFWASELFDPAHPDTYAAGVFRG